jgi:cobalamin-dependent methionine synthase I
LGPQTPVGDVVAAASAKQVDVVALSFSANFPANQMSESLGHLRSALPAEVALWCGGAGAARARRVPEGVRRLSGLHDIGPAISDWRESGGPPGVRGG